MKSLILAFGACGLLAGTLSAQSPELQPAVPFTPNSEQWRYSEDMVRLVTGGTDKRTGAPKLDPKRIINESSSFLKEREPEMTAEEYAIYERVVGMLSSRPEFALRLLEAMMNEKEAPSPAFQFILGNAYYSAGEHAKSEAAYLDAVKRYPTFLRVWSNLGVLYYTQGRYADAVASFSKCVSLGDRDPATYGLLGYSLEQVDKVVPAEVAYMQALAADPTNPDWLDGLLRIYLRGKQYARAEWLVKDLVKQRPTHARNWLAYAEVLMGLNRKPEAMAMLEVCLAGGVAGATEFEALATLYAEQQMVPEALATYRRLLDAAPEVGERKLLNFAETLTAAGRMADAEKVFASIRDKAAVANSPAFRLARADLLAAQKKWPDARTELNRILENEPLNGRALLALGRAYLAENDPARAQVTFESAYQVKDSTYRASLELATLAIKNRNFNRGAEYLEKALSIEKTRPVEDLLARIRPLVAASTP